MSDGRVETLGKSQGKWQERRSKGGRSAFEILCGSSASGQASRGLGRSGAQATRNDESTKRLVKRNMKR
jgi:hypothetical protein